MLNRYGLVDIDKILREQGEEPPAGPPGPDAGAPPGGDAPPPPAPEEDPDEKIDTARKKGDDEDLVEFRKKHADLIYRVAQSRDDTDYSRSIGIQSLRQKFEDSGVDAPFFSVFDPQTSGLSGRAHLSLLASMHHRGKLSGDKLTFLNAGDAAEFAERAPEVRDDLEFEVSKESPTEVRFRQAQKEPESPPAEPEAPPAPPQPGMPPA